MIVDWSSQPLPYSFLFYPGTNIRRAQVKSEQGVLSDLSSTLDEKISRGAGFSRAGLERLDRAILSVDKTILLVEM